MLQYIIASLVLTIAAASICFTRFHLAVRSFLVVGLIVSAWLVFLMIQDYAGKPIQGNVPKDIIVYGQKVDFQNGLVYIMYSEANQKPKLLETELREPLVKALKKGKTMMKGNPFRMMIKEMDENKKGKGNSLSISEEFVIHDLPNPILPKK